MKTIIINNLKWDIDNLIIGRRKYFTYEQALEGAKYRKKRLPTNKELKELFKLGSTWDDILKGRWVAGNHDSDHKGSLFFPASGYRLNGSGGFNYVGTFGYGWSTSSFGSTSIWGAFLGFNSGSVYPLNYTYRGHSFPVRCVSDL